MCRRKATISEFRRFPRTPSELVAHRPRIVPESWDDQGNQGNLRERAKCQNPGKCRIRLILRYFNYRNNELRNRGLEVQILSGVLRKQGFRDGQSKVMQETVQETQAFGKSRGLFCFAQTKLSLRRAFPVIHSPRSTRPGCCYSLAVVSTSDPASDSKSSSGGGGSGVPTCVTSCCHPFSFRYGSTTAISGWNRTILT